MCIAIRFSRFEFQDSQLIEAGLGLSGDEVKVSFSEKNALLPVHYRGRNLLVRWGSRGEFGDGFRVKAGGEGEKRLFLPRTGFCKIESLEKGLWSWLRPQKCIILASSALVNGVWFQVRRGIEAVVVEGGNLNSGFSAGGSSSRGDLHCYILTTPSTHYFKVMTGALRMPLLLNQTV